MSASTACVTKRVASTGLGNAYGPAGTGLAVLLGPHVGFDEAARALVDGAQADDRTTLQARVPNVELATRRRLESRLAHRRAWATACAIVPESVTENVVVTTAGALDDEDGRIREHARLCDECGDGRLVERADAYEAGAACLRGGSAPRSARSRPRELPESRR